MYKNEPSPLKMWQTVTAALAIGLMMSVAGWGWWNGKGPFRAIKATTPPRERFDLLNGVKYVTTEVTSDTFTNSGHVYRWNGEGKETQLFSHWEGEETLWSPPSVKNFHPPPEWTVRPMPGKEGVKVDRKVDLVKKVELVKQDINRELTKVVLAGGLRLLPYATPSQTNVSALSCAHIRTQIKTYKDGETVFFQVKSSVSRPIRAQFKKSMLVYVTLTEYQSDGYVVSEKEALKAIKEVVRGTTEVVLKLSRSREVWDDGEKKELPPNPEEGPARAAPSMMRPSVGQVIPNPNRVSSSI